MTTFTEKIAALPEWPEKPGQSTVFNDTQYDLERMRWYRDLLALAREWIESEPHGTGCPWRWLAKNADGHKPVCTCGRDALLKALEEP